MKKCTILATVTLAAGLILHGAATAHTVYTCDTTIAQEPRLKIEDEASRAGAVVEDPRLITLPNGMASLQFSVRYAKRLGPSGRILRVRYSVDWQDDCGRHITQSTRTIEGLILNPGQYHTVQSTAMHRSASRAVLRIYVSDN